MSDGWLADMTRRELEEREQLVAAGEEGASARVRADSPPDVPVEPPWESLERLEAEARVHPERSLLDYAALPATGDRRLERLAHKVEALRAEQEQVQRRLGELDERAKAAERDDANRYADALAAGKAAPERRTPHVRQELEEARRRSEALTLARRRLAQTYLDELGSLTARNGRRGHADQLGRAAIRRG